jgi:hypothetical protein
MERWFLCIVAARTRHRIKNYGSGFGGKGFLEDSQEAKTDLTCSAANSIAERRFVCEYSPRWDWPARGWPGERPEFR